MRSQTSSYTTRVTRNHKTRTRIRIPNGPYYIPGTPEWWNRVAARAVAAARPTQPMTLEHLFHAYDETQEPSDIGDPDYLEDPDESPDEYESEFEPGLMTITDEPGRGAPAA
ncbi:hypothetical protein B0O80DRAFT_495274 [Mortierella sp. GBAus27b]|nr:hypothetical protein B0O80DRAFT_526400 [Mortierella sp. GBAus27b]KAI8359776.1 hypothetical protein B0O80DRAFT_495274 [Mortierella sp. GBAus27b]